MTPRALVLVAVLIAGCGTESKLDLGGDPHDDTAPVTTADPPGGTYRALPVIVRLETDEPATIHYTIDGSPPTAESPSEESPVVLDGIADGTTIRFFAVDRSRNVEETRTASYTLDITGPARVGSFAIALAGSDASLSWTNPADADFAGVLIARSHGALAAPVDGVSYAPGAVLSSGTEVVFAGMGTSLEQPDLAPALWRWGAWAYDALGNYSRVSVAETSVAIPPQNAHIVVNVPALTATVTVPTATLVVTAGTPTYNAGTTTLTVPLTITNLAARPVHNPKVIVDAASTGTFSNADPGTVSGKPQRSFGVALAPGESATRALTFTGVGPGATVALQVTAGESPFALFGNWDCTAFGGATDLATGRMAGSFGRTPAAEGPGGCVAWHAAVLLLDGHTLLAAARHAPRIERLDLGTLQPVGGVSLGFSEEKASIGGLALDASGRELYAVLHDGNHAFPRSNNQVRDVAAWLVHLDAETLQEKARLRLSSPFDDRVRARRMALSPDGSRLAIPITDQENDRGWIALVRVPELVETDTDPQVAGTQALATHAVPLPAAPFAASEVEFSPDGAFLYANDTWPTGRNQLGIVSLADLSVTTVDVPIVSSLAVGSDGRVFLGSDDAANGVRVYTPGAGVTTLAGTTGTRWATVALTPRGTLMIRANDANQERDAFTGALLQAHTTPGLDTAGNWLLVTPF